MKLDYSTYKYINASVSKELENHSENGWDNYSYKLFKSQPLKTMSDFWKLVAFAYAWMPTIPNIYMEKIKDIEHKVFDEVVRLRKGTGNVKWLYETLTPVINNSVVGTSKVLHFVAPTVVPIYDSRVIEAWSRLFKKDKELRLQYKPGGNIGKVLFYTECMHTWVDNCRKEGHDVSLRDIELILYYYGG